MEDKIYFKEKERICEVYKVADLTKSHIEDDECPFIWYDTTTLYVYKDHCTLIENDDDEPLTDDWLDMLNKGKNKCFLEKITEQEYNKYYKLVSEFHPKFEALMEEYITAKNNI